jgi:hypothetical protein
MWLGGGGRGGGSDDDSDRWLGGGGLTSSAFPTGGQIEFRLAGLYAATYLVIGVQTPFLAVWLGAHGLDINQIGVMLAPPCILQCFAVPLLALWVDRRGGIVRMLAISSILTTVIFVGLILASGVSSILTLVAVLFIAQCASTPIVDVLAFSIYHPDDPKRARGIAREDSIDGPPFDYDRVRKGDRSPSLVAISPAAFFLA